MVYLPFDFMQTNELGEPQSLVAGSNTDRLYSEPDCRVHEDTRMHASRDGCRFINGQPIPRGGLITTLLFIEPTLAHFEDLSDCDYFGDERAQTLKAVGWLDNEKMFRTGRIEPELFAKLKTLLIDPWQPNVFVVATNASCANSTLHSAMRICLFPTAQLFSFVPN